VQTWTSGSTELGTPSQNLDLEPLYRVWKEDGDTAFAAGRSHALDEAVTAGAGRVETLELGHRYGHLSPLVAVA
jgi:hypothetical protein